MDRESEWVREVMRDYGGRIGWEEGNEEDEAWHGCFVCINSSLPSPSPWPGRTFAASLAAKESRDFSGEVALPVENDGVSVEDDAWLGRLIRAFLAQEKVALAETDLGTLAEKG